MTGAIDGRWKELSTDPDWNIPDELAPFYVALDPCQTDHEWLRDYAGHGEDQRFARGRQRKERAAPGEDADKLYKRLWKLLGTCTGRPQPSREDEAGSAPPPA